MDALVTLAALEVACDEGVSPHLARLSEAAATASGPRKLVLERTREALSIHLALLQRHPQALWPVLYAHTAFVDSPRARTFGVSAAGPEMPVFSQVGRWLEERRRLHPGTPWLRALTPTTPWGGALVAELRGLSSPRLAAASEEAVTVDVGAERVSWRPSSGARESQPRPAPSGPPVLSPPGGGLAVPRGQGTQWLLQPGWSVGRVAQSADGARLACVAEDGDEAFLFVFDLDSGEQVDSASAPISDGLALSPDGAFLAFQAEVGVTTIRRFGGHQDARVFTGRASSLAVSADGRTLAQVEDSVVRLYRTDLRARPSPFVAEAPAPMFSRDGAVLMLGRFLFDGVDGSSRGLHGLSPREVLAGGPPPGGRRLTPQRLCVSDDLTTETRELTTGVVTSYRFSHIGSRHRVAWSGDGRLFAACRHGDQTVTLCWADGLREVRATGPVEALALDETGSQLALLHLDGTVELQAGGTRLRRFPGATALAFLAGDSALAVGGARSTAVVGLDGRERWHAERPFDGSDAAAADIEWRSGLRPPSVAERLELTTAEGLLTARHGADAAVFPATDATWLRAPASTLLTEGKVLLSWEQG